MIAYKWLKSISYRTDSSIEKLKYAYRPTASAYIWEAFKVTGIHHEVKHLRRGLNFL